MMIHAMPDTASPFPACRNFFRCNHALTYIIAVLSLRLLMNQAYQNGLYGCAEDLKKALENYEKAAAKGHDISKMRMIAIRKQLAAAEKEAEEEEGGKKGGKKSKKK